MLHNVINVIHPLFQIILACIPVFGVICVLEWLSEKLVARFMSMDIQAKADAFIAGRKAAFEKKLDKKYGSQDD